MRTVVIAEKFAPLPTIEPIENKEQLAASNRCKDDTAADLASPAAEYSRPTINWHACPHCRKLRQKIAPLNFGNKPNAPDKEAR